MQRKSSGALSPLFWMPALLIVVFSTIKSSSASDAPELSASQTEYIDSLIAKRVLWISREAHEAEIAHELWNKLGVKSKEKYAAAFASYIGKSGPSEQWVDIYDHSTRSKIARFSRADGFTLFSRLAQKRQLAEIKERSKYARTNLDDHPIERSPQWDISLKTAPESEWSDLFGAGWVGNFPTLPAGLQGHIVRYRKFGLYFDLKSTFSGPSSDSYYESISRVTAETVFGDPFVKDHKSWISINLGATYGLFSWFALYGGVGYSRLRYSRNYNDPTGILGRGNYWIHDPSGDEDSLNAIGGALFAWRFGERKSNALSLSIGYEKKPTGFSLGLSYCTAHFL